ncbi:hypothetical protein TNCV_1412151 [Trichonephila clavipes]|nr:hypothetical protein TNCV_1412151 [Trichonephila clavipes]
MRANKNEPIVQEVELIEANPDYAHVKLGDGRETTVSGSHLNPRLHEVSVGPTLCFGSRFLYEAPYAPEPPCLTLGLDSRLTPVPRRFPFETCPTLCFDSCMPPVPRCV